jgi:UTP--glucose-1-phosphate uridylyltransferase
MTEKSDPETAPSNWAGVGRYVCNPDIFIALETITQGKDGEIGITEGIQRLVQVGKTFYGYSPRGGQTRFDTGNFEGYVEAFKFFAEKTGMEYSNGEGSLSI